MPYEFFAHTGDIGIRVWGQSLDELMESAVLAFAEAIVEPASVQAAEAAVVECRAESPDLLLHDLLSELVYRFDARERLTRDAVVRVGRDGSAWTLEAALRGEHLDRQRHHLKVLVKGVTYHALSVLETSEGWQGTVILDI